MIINKKNSTYLTFESFEKIDFINHCFSTRLGGISTGDFRELNLGFNRGDLEENVLENFKILSRDVGFDFRNIVMTDQVHNNKIEIVNKNDRGKGIIKKNNLKNIDGLITNEKNLVLTTFYADCTPLYFVDIKNKVIGLSHSGWQGTILKIGLETVNKMIENFGSEKENIYVGIGPSICGECFEVDEEVYLKFKKIFEYIDEYTIYKKNINKYYIDTQLLNKKILIDEGIPEKNIELPNICTKCNKELFYSHRNMGTRRGSLGGFLEIK